MNEIVMTKISTHKKGETGKLGVSMYTFVYGTGKNKKSVTKHMTEAQASAFKNQLQGGK